MMMSYCENTWMDTYFQIESVAYAQIEFYVNGIEKCNLEIFDFHSKVHIHFYHQQKFWSCWSHVSLGELLPRFNRSQHNNCERAEIESEITGVVQHRNVLECARDLDITI